MPKFSPLDINTFGDNSFQNHNRVQATVNTLGDNPPQVAEFTPVAQSANAQSYLNMIRQYSENGAFNPSVADATLYGDSKFASEVYKLNPQGAGFKEYNVGIDDLYTELNSGEMVAKYETYTPGIDNEEMLARNQGAAQVAMRGYKRFQNQVLTSFVGNLTAIPVGIFEWINTGNFEASYINGYTEWLDDLDTRSQLNNNIYYTQAEKDMSLGQSVFTSRFLFDKALGGAAFTVGMMLSEGAMAYATGGASLATTGARIGARIGTKIALKQAGKTAAKGLNRANTILAETAAAGNIGSKIAQKSGQWANYGSRTGKFINDARFVVTSSGYEAGMEARMFQKEAEESFYEYYKNLGIEPTAEDIREFRSNVYSEANKVFGANMGILGASNVALFGRMFGVGNPLKFISKPLNSIIDKKVFGIATKQVANGQFVAATRKTYQKILSAGWNGFVKPGFSEGVWEEGGQGIASEMMSNYMKSTYDHNAMREISGYTDSFYKAIDTQFTTKEGQESVLIGALIGTVFGGFGGSFTRASQMAKDQNRIAELETKVAQAPEQITKALYSKENFLSQVGNLSRIMNLEDSVQESERKGEIAEASLKTTAMIISSLQAAFQVGKDGSFLKVLVGSIQGVDNKTIMEQYNLNTVEEAAAFKADRVAAVNQIAEWYEHNANLSDTFIGEGRLPKTMRGKEQLIKDALAFSLTMSQVSEKIAVDAISTIKDVYSRLGDTTSENVADIIGIFSLSDPEIIKSYNEAKEQYRIQEEEVRKKVKELQTEQTKPESIRSVEELTRLGEELAAAEEKFATISSTYNGIKATMENRYFEKIDNTGIGSIVDFENLNTSLDKTRTALDALEKVHPEAHARLATAFDTLQKATTYSQEFSDIYKGLLDPKFNTRVANGIFSGRVANKRSLNEVTEETLNRILMAGVKLDNEGNITPTITTLTQDVFDEFKKTGEVGTEVLDEIAIKLFEKQDLTPQEQEVYNAKKSEIDSIVKEIVKAEVVTKLQNDESLSQEEQRIYEEFKDEIDDILDDPLNNATGEEINEQQDIPELSEELRAQFDEHENKRQEELKGLNEEDAEVINELFDEMYEYSVAKGEITAEQALKELEKIGQEGSKSYNKINTLSLKGRAVRLRALREKLKEIISNSKVIQKYFENKESINIRNISDEEIKRFYELRDKRNSKSSLKDTESDRLKELQNKTDLSDEEFLEKEKLVLKSERGGMTSEEFSEMEELENRLFEYNVLQGTVFEGASLLELLKLYHQTNKDIENIDVNKDSHTEEEYVEIALTEEKEGGVPPERREAISQITEYGLLKYVKGSALISHIQLSDLIARVPDTAKIKINGVEVNDGFEKYNAIDGTVVEIEMSPTEVYELRIESKATKGGKAPSGKRIGVPIELKADNPKETLRDVFGITTPSIAGQRGGYYLAYEEVGGVSRPIKATEEFTIKNDSGLVYDPIETRRLKSGDEVELVYDTTDYYNKTLDKKSIIKEANIYIVKNGKIVGRLKSADKVKDSNLYNIRKSVVEAEGKITIEVSAVLSGLPIIQTEQGGGKKLIPVNNNDIVAQGYIQDGQIVGDMPDEVSKRFIVAASNNSPGMRVPFVVVKDKISGANVAFPVEIEPIGNIDALFAFDDVLQNDSLSDSEKALLLNEILIENGVSLEDYWLTPEIIEDNAYIGEVREAVSQTQSTLDLDDFASGEKYNVLTVINFENEAFTAPKVVLDFDSVKESGEKKKPTPTSKEEEEERMREVIKKVAEKISVITYKVKGLTRRIVFKSEIDKNLMRYKSRGVTAEENEKIFQYLSKTFPKVGNRNMTVTDINEVARDFRREVKKRIEEAEQGRTNFTFEAIHSEITAEFIRRKKLPPSLRTATQEFSPLIEGNNRTRTISFESPLDKALFIVANVGRKATDYNSVAKWLKDNYNLTLPQAIKMGLKVRKKAKESVDAQEDGVVAIEEIVKISPKEEDDSEQIIGLIRENYVKATIRNSQGRFENVVGVFLKDEGVIVVGDKVIEAGKVKSFKPVNVKITPALVKQVRKALEEC